MLKRLLLFAWIGLMIVMVGCEGKEGQVGPKGDAGAAGPTGPAGPAGPAGEDGTGAGSGAFILSSGAGTTDSTGGYFTGIGQLTADEDSLLSESAVFVYIKSGGVYWPLPGVVAFGTAASEFTFVHGVQESTFFVDIFQRDWSEAGDVPPKRTFQDVRVVIIPAVTLEPGRINSEILKSYEKTIAALGLTEENVKASQQLGMRFKKK